MPFSYYERLSEKNKAIYRRSDRVTEIVLPRPELLEHIVGLLRTALERDQRPAVQATAGAVCRGITEMLDLPPVEVQVLAVRPSSRHSELHGLYTSEDGATPTIRVWMRTARHRRVVAFRTFLRTLLHEITHHLDFQLLELEDSLHTEGFFKRESSLFRQLVPEPSRQRAGGVVDGPGADSAAEDAG